MNAMLHHMPSPRGFGRFFMWLTPALIFAGFSTSPLCAKPDAYCSTKNLPVSIHWRVPESQPITSDTAACTLEITAQADLPRLKVLISANTSLGVPDGLLDEANVPRKSVRIMPVSVSRSATIPSEAALNADILIYNADGSLRWQKRIVLNALNETDGLYIGAVHPTTLVAARWSRLAQLDPSRVADRDRALERLSTQRARVKIPALAPADRKTATAEKPTTNLGLSGRYQWQDLPTSAGRRATGGLYPCAGLTVEAYDKADSSKTVLATAVTDSTGAYTLSVPRNRVDTTTDAFTLVLRIQSKHTAFELKTESFLILFGGNTYTYEVELEGVTDQASIDAVADKLQVVFHCNESDDNQRWNDRAWAVYSCLYFLHQVTGKTSIIASTPSYVARFPSSDTQYSSFFNEIEIIDKDYADFDVVAHEYGHLLQNKFSLVKDSTGGSHSGLDDLIKTNGKDEGSRLAWSEGMATALGLLLELEGGASYSYAPRFGDTSYDDYEDGALTAPVEETDANTPPSEGNEWIVSRILFDYADNLTTAEPFDVSAVGLSGLIAKLRSTYSARLADFWQGLTSSQIAPSTITTQLTSISQTVSGVIAPIFAYNGVAPMPLAPKGAAEIPATGDTITFRWRGGVNTVYADQRFRILFLDTTGRVVASSDEVMRSGSEVTADVPRSRVTEARTSVGSSGALYWTVAAVDNASPATGVYVGPPLSLDIGANIIFVIDDTGSMTEEISAVRDGLLQVIDRLASSGTSSTLQLITFKDDVTVRSPTSDLSVIQKQVSGLIASGGGDEPEASVEALWEAARLIKNSGGGGTIFLATDAPPHAGLSIPATVNALRSAGARVNVILTESGFSKPDAVQTNLQSASVDGEEPGSYISPITPVEMAGLIPDAGFTGSVDAFGDIATGTGGTLLTMSKSDATRITSAVENLTVSGLLGGVVQVLPTSAPAGSHLVLVIEAQNTNFDERSVVAFSRDVTVNSIKVDSPIRIEADVTIGSAALSGDQTVTVTTGSESVNGVNVFAIESAADSARILSVLPAEIPRGASATLKILGYNTNFTDLSNVTFAGGGITTNRVRQISATELVADITLDPTADRTFRTATIDGLSLAKAIRVTSIGVADVGVVATLTPNKIVAGTSIALTITGAGVTWNNASTVSFSGGGITVDSVTATGAGELQAHITASLAAATGFRDVFVHTGETVVSGLQLLNVTAPVAAAIDTEPADITPNRGDAAVFTVAASGTPAPAYRWQVSSDSGSTWSNLTDSEPYSGTDSAELRIASTSAEISGNQYRVIVTNEVGSPVISRAATLVTLFPHLVNISSRAASGAGDRVSICGFVIGGHTSKRMLLRAIGPSLIPRGVNVADAMADPSIELHDIVHHEIVASNDNWSSASNATDIAAVGAMVGAFPVETGDTTSSALLLKLDPGVYTFVMQGKAAKAEVVLGEVYDADADATSSTLVNVSVRSFCTPGNGVTIGGFVIKGAAAKRVLVRAVGPSLSMFGLAADQLLSDPRLTLHNALDSNVVVASNDNWEDNANATDIVATTTRIGANALSNSDHTSAALLLTLQPGVYSAVADSKAGQSGIVLVEIYDVD